MWQCGAIERAPMGPSYVSRQFVVKQTDKNRVIFDLHQLNQNVQADRFHLPTVRHYQQMLQPCSYQTTVDIKSAYLHVLMHPSARPFLRFWHQETLLQYKTLPFGLNSAPFHFHSLSSWIARKMREKGIKLTVFYDDFGLTAQSNLECQHQTQMFVNYLIHLGFFISEKSHLEPSQQVTFLGLAFDTLRGVVQLPPTKQDNLGKRLRKWLRLRVWSLRTV